MGVQDIVLLAVLGAALGASAAFMRRKKKQGGGCCCGGCSGCAHGDICGKKKI